MLTQRVFKPMLQITVTQITDAMTRQIWMGFLYKKKP
jgi:hypothetical protein